MKEVDYRIHHQVIVDCPDCQDMHIEDLGEDDCATGMVIFCECGCEFELYNEI